MVAKTADSESGLLTGAQHTVSTEEMVTVIIAVIISTRYIETLYQSPRPMYYGVFTSQPTLGKPF